MAAREEGFLLNRVEPSVWDLYQDSKTTASVLEEIGLLRDFCSLPAVAKVSGSPELGTCGTFWFLKK